MSSGRELRVDAHACGGIAKAFRRGTSAGIALAIASVLSIGPMAFAQSDPTRPGKSPPEEKAKEKDQPSKQKPEKGSPGKGSPNNPSQPTSPATAPATSPSGGKGLATSPTTTGLANASAIERFDPQVYDVSFGVTITGMFIPFEGDGPDLSQSPIVLPLIMQGPFSSIDRSSLQPKLFFNQRADSTVSQRAKLVDNQELGMTFATIPVGRFESPKIAFSVSWKSQVWSCRVDEATLARQAWPNRWPDDVSEALKPQKGIESEGEFADMIVVEAVGRNPKVLPPWIAAKEILRTVAGGFKSIYDETFELRRNDEIVGMKLEGAEAATKRGKGSRHDLVAVAVAALRAADIPARAVVGISEEGISNQRNRKVHKTALISWGEVFVPTVGWVPFDLDELRSVGFRKLDVAAAWPGVGNWADLNERVPIAWCFAPRGYAGSNFASLWGWNPFGDTEASTLTGVIELTMVSRGRGAK
ncbi:MAG: hypothetical protein JNL80_06740 [Phycisphaerae bacterium]|nr:hypothetical protein [Phycisphaerae bacterium]